MTFPLGEKEVLPIVKRGIVCAEMHDDDGHQVLLIDVIANPGFSGGPLAYRRHDTNAWAFAGAVQQSILAPVAQPTDGVSKPAGGPLRLVTRRLSGSGSPVQPLRHPLKSMCSRGSP